MTNAKNHDGRFYTHGELIRDSLDNAICEATEGGGVWIDRVISALKRDGYAIYNIQTVCQLACAIERPKHEALYTQVLGETYP